VLACEGDYVDLEAAVPPTDGGPADAVAIAARVKGLRQEMRAAAKALEFERAATLRDEIRALEQRAVGLRADA
jgi:protein-arginine kinase activator protein McsA